MYDIIIVGGGISGLYSCYYILKHNPSLKICIIEQSGRWGGRIYTKYKDGLSFESGAGRFHSSHSNLMQLLKEFKLNNKLFPLSKNISYFLKNKWIKNDKELMTTYKSSFKSLDDIWTFIFNNPPSNNSTLYEHCLKIGLSKDETECVKDTYGYLTEFIDMNTNNALDMIKYDFKNGTFYTLKGGLQQLIDLLVDKCKEFGATMLLNTSCISLNRNTNVIELSNSQLINKIKANKIILSIPINSFNNLTITPPINWLKKYQPKPYKLLRIYAKYPSDWFRNMSKIITDKKLSMIIPINPDNGLIMISYSDNINAQYWNNFYDINILKNKLNKQLTKLFPTINIDDPEWISIEYWNEGCHYWEKNNNDKLIMEDINNQLGNNIFLLNEAYAHINGWIESSLIVANKYIQNITNSFKGGSKTYTMNDVSKHNNIEKGVWTVINKRVYDITKWVPEHPGGIAKIMQIAGKDGTNLFMNNPFHKGTDAKKILEKYYIGDLS
jgi:cytochrome b involved in lipid metabolism